MKKMILVFFSVILLLVLCIYCWNYYTKYYINTSEKEVKAFLEEFSESKIELLSFEQIDDTNIWLAHFQLNEKKFNYAQFREGWNHKVKFIYLKTYPNVTYDELNTNKGKYGVIFANNLDENIVKIKLQSQLKNFETEIDTSTSKIFIRAIKLPENVENTAPAIFYFYDKNGNLYDY
ncbi:hypothetical protein [Metasolibacillus meyeri]|uniref:hypothetical protein n=1 Tax=Metasolibacillus meyeri TaxID=1071052 RepID=UPI000D2F551A|nr:hypothetical protein [Metasolibacillus meyeri]